MDDADALRQQLRDEAAWRAFVEEQLAREAEKAQVWRERAEERAARIERLTAGRSLRNAIASRVAGASVTPTGIPDPDVAAEHAASAVAVAQHHRRARYPEVRAATLVSSAAAQALAAELDHRDIAREGVGAWRDADVALVEAAAWTATPDAHDAVLAWLATPERPPVAWYGSVPEAVDAALGPRDVVIGGAATASPSLDLPPWAAAVPTRQLPRPGFPGRWAEDGHLRLLVTTTSTALAMAGGDAHRALGLAAAGIPVLDRDGSAPHGLPGPMSPIDLAALDRGGEVPDDLRRLAIRQRRWVEAQAGPADRVTTLLDALGVPSVAHEPRLAVLLSSNKPALVPAQIASLGRQARRPDELRVALHGGATLDEQRAVEAAADAAGLPLHVSTPGADRPLGSVLNDLADASTATHLAKIDDDDHYGPSHLLDAMAAIRATGADLVGRKAHYVHLTGPDHTWLLADDAEDAWTTQGVMGATFVWRRGLHADVRFLPRPRRVDSLYVRAVAAAGARMYALPANDFAYVRGPGGRTNVAGEDYVRARGRDVGPGLPLDIVDV